MELNNQYIGSYIKFMRRRAGLTQQKLAERIGVGSKTISKWEQGRGIPDISLLYGLSIELDVDIESLLAGNLDDIGKEWTGIICVDRTMEPNLGEWEWECMVSMFLLAGIKNIAVFCANGDIKKLKALLQEYWDKGFLQKIYCTDSYDELMQYIMSETGHICLLYQPAFLYGMHLTRYMRRAMLGKETKVLTLRQGKESIMPEIVFNKSFSCISLGEKVESEWHMFPMIFGTCKTVIGYLEQIKKEWRMDIDHGMLLEFFAPISVEAMERGMLAFSFKAKRDRILAKQVLSGIEESQDIKIGNLEEIMKVRGWK